MGFEATRPNYLGTTQFAKLKRRKMPLKVSFIRYSMSFYFEELVLDGLEFIGEPKQLTFTVATLSEKGYKQTQY